MRKVIFSGSSSVGDWVPAQAIDLPNTATERSPSVPWLVHPHDVLLMSCLAQLHF